MEPVLSVETPRSRIRTGYTATIFGATGFLGRYLVNRLGMVDSFGQENILTAVRSSQWSDLHHTLPRGHGKATSQGCR
jgi:thioester reductase-like protein